MARLKNGHALPQAAAEDAHVLKMPRSAALDRFVQAVRVRDNVYGQAAQSPMIKPDMSRSKAPVYTPSVQGVPQPHSGR